MVTNEKQHLFQGIYIGVSLILMAIALLYKISSVKYINYYYIGYLFSNLVLFLFLNEYTAEYLFHTNYRIDLCLFVTMHVAALFFIQFVRNYFVINNRFPILDQFAGFYVKAGGGTVFGLLVLAYFDFVLYLNIAIYIELLNQFIILLLVSLVFIRTDNIGKIIIVGAYISSISFLYMIFKSDLISLTVSNLLFYQSGYLAEILLMLIAINFRYKHFEMEKQHVLVRNLKLETENKLNMQENLLLK